MDTRTNRRAHRCTAGTGVTALRWQQGIGPDNDTRTSRQAHWCTTGTSAMTVIGDQSTKPQGQVHCAGAEDDLHCSRAEADDNLRKTRQYEIAKDA
jgi:hypothetical protein